MIHHMVHIVCAISAFVIRMQNISPATRHKGFAEAFFHPWASQRHCPILEFRKFSASHRMIHILTSIAVDPHKFCSTLRVFFARPICAGALVETGSTDYRTSDLVATDFSGPRFRSKLCEVHTIIQYVCDLSLSIDV